MVMATVDQYGAPSYGALGLPPAGVVFHTPENADHTLASAIGIAKWQASTGNTSGGSYHGILGYDASRGAMTRPDAWVMVRSVPWNRAAGGLSSNRDPAIWRPDRFPWIKELISPAAYLDPNKYMHQIALSGKAAWYVANGYPSGLVTRLAEWVRTLEKAYNYNAVLTLHRMWQTNRSDPGPLTLGDLVLAEYERMFNAPAPAPVPTPEPVPAPDPTVLLQSRLDAKDADIQAAIDMLNRAKGR